MKVSNLKQRDSTSMSSTRPNYPGDLRAFTHLWMVGRFCLDSQHYFVSTWNLGTKRNPECNDLQTSVWSWISTFLGPSFSGLSPSWLPKTDIHGSFQVKTSSSSSGSVGFRDTERIPQTAPQTLTQLFHKENCQKLLRLMYLNLLWLIVPPGKQKLKVYGRSQLHIIIISNKPL